MISVVVPAYNAEGVIGDCVRALRHQQDVPMSYEIIVVDDGSQDGTGRAAQGAGAILIRNERRLGASASRNHGIATAKGEIICFTDADCTPRLDWLAEIVRPLRAEEIAGCKGVYTTCQKSRVARFVQLEYEDKYDRLRSQPRIDFIDTYSAAYRRNLLVESGGFDERISFVEDQELSFRLAARGYEMVFQPSAVVSHLHSDSIASYFWKKLQIGYWKAQIIRHYPERAVSDSHTPQVMKVQMGLVAMALVAIVASPLFGWTAIAGLGLLFVFKMSTIPFARKALVRDREIALVAPFLLMVRAIALGLGYAWGIVHRQATTTGDLATIGGVGFFTKRVIDVAGGLAGCLLMMPLAPLLMAVIKIDSSGPVFFRQKRIGRGGRPFTLYKFRTMFAAGDSRHAAAADLPDRGGLAAKPKSDPRLTSVGRFLRRWSLDETPQFWNVLKGEMSLVGPRPEEPRIVAGYSDWHRRRLAVKPGMTGPMQVSGRADLTLDERVTLDLAYIERFSIWRDLILLLRTIPALIKGTGAR
jgi:lipopolysaccharide/colanic/teichoic acid biosynthesis glycosyltransferase/glycosyltransferase involved in cell wall biosynthesis